MKRFISIVLILTLLLSCLSFTACKKDKNDSVPPAANNNNNNGNNNIGNNSNTNKDNNTEGFTADKVYVEMDFGSYGKIVIEVDRKSAPITSDNFLSLVKNGFYDGLTIFRAQRSFVIQGGEDKSADLEPIVGEFSSNGHTNPLSHTRGAISMARTTDPNSATSQFFITLSDIAAYSLDGEYAAFGYVVEGMDVVDGIATALFGYAINSMGFVSDDNAITINSAKILKNYTPSVDENTPTVDNTDVMGSGACDYFTSRDISGRDIKYVEMCIEGYGRLVILLDATTAPITVANFISLVESGFYDGLTFHRVIKDFMIQGGDPSGNGTGGSEETIFGEFSSNGHENDISHKYGVISMARSNDPNSASSQFFICNADATSLDGSYAAFGYVIEGMSVIDELTSKVFPKTAYADYYGSYEIDYTYQTYKHYVWQYLGNGAIENKSDQPVIKYIKLIDPSEINN